MTKAAQLTGQTVHVVRDVTIQPHAHSGGNEVIHNPQLLDQCCRKRVRAAPGHDAQARAQASCAQAKFACFVKSEMEGSQSIGLNGDDLVSNPLRESVARRPRGVRRI